MMSVVRAALPFLAVLFVFLIMITYIPWISTILPNTFMGSGDHHPIAAGPHPPMDKPVARPIVGPGMGETLMEWTGEAEPGTPYWWEAER